MNTDIRILISFKGHKKRKKLKRLLGDGYLDYLIDFWIDVALTRPDGTLDGWDAGDIADAAGWDGNSDVFCRALQDAGFLDFNGTEFKCHDWEDHQGWVCGADARSEKARKAAKARWDKKYNATSSAGGNAPSNAKSNASGKSKQSGKDAKGNAPNPSPNPSPKEEKNTPFRAIDYLVKNGVKKQTALDWLKVRKTKRAANTETAFDKILQQMDKKGLNYQKGIEICVQESWAGFKSSWDLPDDNESGNKDAHCDECTGSLSHGGCPLRTDTNRPPPGKNCFNKIEGKR